MVPQVDDETEFVPRNIKLVLFTPSSFITAYVAAQMGYICAHIDLTGERISAFEREAGASGKFLHCVVVSIEIAQCFSCCCLISIMFRRPLVQSICSPRP